MTQFAASTHQGLVRDHNEDCYDATPELGLWLVADGVGGHANGEVASDIVRTTIRDDVAEGKSLIDAITHAHEAVLAEIKSRDTGSNMGSTVVALRLTGNEYEIAWVGDSRAYLYDGAVRQLSRDHNPVSELVAAGILTREQAAKHPDRHVLTQSLGVSDTVNLKPDRITGTLQPGQQIILCSDGLSDGVSTVAMAGIMKHQHTNQAQVKALQDAALGAGGHDNVTIVVVGSPEETTMVAADDTRPDLQTTQELPTMSASAAPVSHNGKILLLAGVMMALAIWWIL